jgi:hypothetical protein
MPTIYTNNFQPIDLTDEEYQVYMRNFVNQPTDPNQRPGSTPALTANLEPISQTPQAGTLGQYYPNYEQGLYGQAGRAGTQAGVAIAAAGAGAATGGAAGLWMLAGDYIMRGVHGDSWTPDKYKTLTNAGRAHYLDPNAEHRNPTNRAIDFSPISSEDNAIDPRLINYLSRVQPYEDMAYYNPRTLAGKQKAYGYSEWAKQRIAERWRDDMDAIEAQELANRYGLDLPDRLKNRGPFKVNPNSFR